MRNLITFHRGNITPQSQTVEDLQLLTSSFDTINDSITVVLGNLELGVIEVQQYSKDGTIAVLASFNLPVFNDKILSFVDFSDVNKLIFVMQQGDIICATYDPFSMDYTSTMVEIAGSIDNGLKAAKWSYDEETLALVSVDGKVILLSRDFDPINETELQLEDLKKSKHVNVGWGKKETQFRGKGVRAMEREALKSLQNSGLVGNQLRDPTMPYMVDKGEITSFDTKDVEISWRGDCEYFAVSSVETVEDADDSSKVIDRRVIRVYNREGQLDSASEPVDGMEQSLSWKPQGSLIASIQRKTFLSEEEEEGQSLDLIFFERNGLRHGEFDTRLPLAEPVKDLTWNSTSDILTIVLEDRIQLWTTKNYHWFLKQEIISPGLVFCKWHPEKEFTLMFGDSNGINITQFAYKITHGPTTFGSDYGTTVVVDGQTVNITPLSIANVPPPIYFRDFDAPNAVLDVAVSHSNEIYAALTNKELVIAKVDSMEQMRKGQHPSIRSTLDASEFASNFDTLRQIAFISENIVVILLDSESFSQLAMIDVQDPSQPALLNIVDTYDKVVLLKSTFDYQTAVFETKSGQISQLTKEGQIIEITKLPQVVVDFRVTRIKNKAAETTGQALQDEYEDDANIWTSSAEEDSHYVAFGLTQNGKLFANDVQLTSAVTSLEVSDNFLFFTTAQHNLQFVHLNSSNFKPLPVVDSNVSDERVRSVERGSVLVSVVPSKSMVVLQASRGNLESIHPRIMVLSEVRKHIKNKQFLDALLICRTHRISLDILHDYDPELFYNNLDHFINDIGRVDYLDLFISCLVEENVCETKYKETLNISSDEPFALLPAPLTDMQLYIKKKFFDAEKSKANKICKAMLETLLSKPEYVTKYLQSIITAYACQNPPNLKDALSLITTLQDEDKKDSMVTYICFLQDVNVVYNVALSLYNIPLSLAIAQKSQMDPREYLPFLQELSDSEENEMKFMIDDHLGNHELAVYHLSNTEIDQTEISENTLDYIEVHKLFKYALGLYKRDQKKQNQIYGIFAKELASTQEYSEAAIIYEMLGNHRSAMDNYVSCKKWNEALSLASQYFPDSVNEVADELITALNYEHKYVDSAQIELKYLKNVKEAISLYCKAYYYHEAINVCTFESDSLGFIEEVVDSGLDEGFSVIAELLADCKGQVNSQVKRLRELREKKEQDPYAFYGEEVDQADDVSIAPSETSTRESFFTRYTGKTGGTAQTGTSRKTAKNKRRQERKKARGKKGTIYEEEYLVRSIGRLIDRLQTSQPDAVRLIEGLLRRHKMEQAYQIQKNYTEVLDLLKQNVVEIYTISEKDRERIDDNGEVYYIEEIPVPKIEDFPVNKVIDY
ncbi:Elongator subunit iki3 [Hanseniaspora vineae]